MTRQNVASGSPYEPIIGFSRAVRIGNTIAVGGTAPIGADGKTVGIGDPAAQTRRAIEIIKTAIEKAGGKLDHVIRTRVFLTRQQDWEAIGRAHGEAFGTIRPASTMAVVKQLLNDEWLVEIEADAIVE
jgi:enamine deaminase RidA (YjgF/YER057c/UK114 family)